MDSLMSGLDSPFHTRDKTRNNKRRRNGDDDSWPIPRAKTNHARRVNLDFGNTSANLNFRSTKTRRISLESNQPNSHIKSNGGTGTVTGTGTGTDSGEEGRYLLLATRRDDNKDSDDDDDDNNKDNNRCVNPNISPRVNQNVTLENNDLKNINSGNEGQDSLLLATRRISPDDQGNDNWRADTNNAPRVNQNASLENSNPNGSINLFLAKRRIFPDDGDDGDDGGASNRGCPLPVHGATNRLSKQKRSTTSALKGDATNTKGKASLLLAKRRIFPDDDDDDDEEEEEEDNLGDIDHNKATADSGTTTTTTTTTSSTTRMVALAEIPSLLDAPFDYSVFLFKLEGDRMARDIIQPHVDAMIDILDQHGLYNDPRSPYNTQLAEERVTNCRRVYSKYLLDVKQSKVPSLSFKKSIDLNQTAVLDKVGSSAQFQDRRNRDIYKAITKNTPPPIFRIVVDYDNIPQEPYHLIEKESNAALKKLATDERLDPFQRHYFGDLLGHFQGDRLGLKPRFELEMLEYGTQRKAKLTAEVEGVMFCKKTSDLAYAFVMERSTRMNARMHCLQDAAAKSGTFYHRSVTSWKTGSKAKYSSTIQATKCVLGVVDESDKMWCNTLPVPAKPNGTTEKENFSTDYNNTQKWQGRTVVPREVAELRQQSHGLLEVDTNQLIYQDFQRDSVEDHLVEMGFYLDSRHLDGNVALFMDTTNPARVVRVHSPLGVAGDSRPEVPIINIVKAQMMVAVLTNSRRLLQRKAHLTPNDTSFNPIHGMFSYQVTRVGNHADRKTAAAFWRQCISSPEADCLVNNELPKTPLQNTPGPIGLRLRVNPKSQEFKDLQDSKLFLRVHCVINNRNFTTKQMGDKVCKMLTAGKKAQNTARLWKRLLGPWFLKLSGTKIPSRGAHILPDTPIHGILTTAKNSKKVNAGNTNEATRVNLNGQERVEHNAAWRAFLATHLPFDDEDYGPSFWVAGPGKPPRPANGTWADNDVPMTFPGRDDSGRMLDVFELIGFHGVRGKCKPHMPDGHLKPNFVCYKGTGVEVAGWKLVRMVKKDREDKKLPQLFLVDDQLRGFL